MKKIFLIFLLTFLFLTQVQAGLFEYHVTGKSAGVSRSLAPDIESLEVQASYTYNLRKTGGYLNTSSPYSKTNTYTRKYNRASKNVFANDYYKSQGNRMYSAAENTRRNNDTRLCYSNSQYQEYSNQDSYYPKNCSGFTKTNYTTQPSWVNPDLPIIKNGRIYIK
ncbi:hypothetical protein GW846_00675 [Candidatus Gracilibacteria bacterium]|nr:hypothetical protein [Candidatus Gracilibacteria bacterium]